MYREYKGADIHLVMKNKLIKKLLKRKKQKELEKIGRRLREISNLLRDMNMKLCHFVKENRRTFLRVADDK